MRGLIVLFRFLMLEAALLLPLSSFVFVLAGARWVVIVSALFVVLSFAIMFCLHWLVPWLVGANSSPSAGLLNSLGRAMEKSSHLTPRLLVISDPSPNAIIAKSLSGRGLIILSQGLLGILSEDELRVVLRRCVLRLQSSEAVLQTLCSVLACGALSLAPRTWVRLAVMGGGPLTDVFTLKRQGSLGFLFFIMVFSLARMLLALGGRGRISSEVLPETGQWDDAMRKIAKTIRIHGLELNPGFIPLCLHYPWVDASILPLCSDGGKG